MLQVRAAGHHYFLIPCAQETEDLAHSIANRFNAALVVSLARQRTSLPHARRHGGVHSGDYATDSAWIVIANLGCAADANQLARGHGRYR
jgi:hypothetical protein